MPLIIKINSTRLLGVEQVLQNKLLTYPQMGKLGDLPYNFGEGNLFYIFYHYYIKYGSIAGDYGSSNNRC